MRLAFQKFGVLVDTAPRRENYDYDHVRSRFVRHDEWRPVWWWPANWVLLPIAAYVAMLIVGGQGKPE